MHHKALGLELTSPILLDGVLTNEIVVLKINCTDKEAEKLTFNVLKQINTDTGIYSVSVSDSKGNPYNPQEVRLDLRNIKMIESL